MFSILNRYPQTWEEALPIGDGTLGALLMSRCDKEGIILSHEDLFLPMDSDVCMPDLVSEMNKAKEQIKRGEMRAAQDDFFDSAIKKFSHAPTNGAERFYPDQYVAAGKIDIAVPTAEKPVRTKAVLDFETACAHIEWNDTNKEYTRDCFISYADHIGIVHLTCSENASYTIGISSIERITEKDHYLHDRFFLSERTYIKGNTVRFDCFFKRNGGYSILANIIGGDIETIGNKLLVSGRDILIRYTILLDTTAEFDFSSFPENYEILQARHINAWQKDYLSCSLSFGADELKNLPNEELLLVDTEEKRRACYERMYAFGRYVMLSDFGRLPPNAQGIWNGNPSSWVFSDYVLDIELEMAYFPAFACGNDRCLSALLNMIHQYMPDWRENARMLYGAKGFLVACRSTNSGRLTHFSKPFPMEFWITGGAWIAGMLFDAYRINVDNQFLEEEVLPFMREAAEFFMDVYEEGPDGRLWLLPGMSPENEPLGVDTMAARNVTMDISMLKQMFTNLIEGTEKLNLPVDERWKKFLKNLPDYMYNPDGSLCEWADPAFKDKDAHRHLSHMYAAYPGEEAVSGDKQLFAGSKTALKKRLHEGFIKYFCGWSIGHAACAAARLGMGTECMLLLDRLIAEYVNKNLFTTLNAGREWFQIDANHAFVAAMHEMLIFSNENEIRLLPGYESIFNTGSLKGISLTGGRKLLDLSWNIEANTIDIHLVPTQSESVRFTFPKRLRNCTSNGEVAFEEGEQFLTARLTANTEFILNIQL